MPRHRRKHVTTIQPWGFLRKHWRYRGRIRSVSIENAPDYLRVEIVNLDPTELDRVHIVNLPMPARPGNRTSKFLKACGLDVTVGASIDLDELVDCIVAFRVRDSTAGEAVEFDFERIEAAPVAEKRAPAADDSENRPSESKDGQVFLTDQDIPF